MFFENEIILCRYFTAVDVKLVSREIPPSVMSDKELKRYLHISMYAHHRYGKTRCGHNDFKKVCRCSSDEFKRITERLEDLGLIETEPYGKKMTTYTAKMLPFYDADKGRFVQIIDCPRTGYAFRVNRVHFIAIPTEALHQALSLPRQELMVLLKLYRYNHLPIFRGVDPNVLRIVDGNWYVHPKLPFDLFMTEEEFIACVNELIEAGLLFKGKVGLYPESFDFEARYRVTDGDGAEIIVPVYQWWEADQLAEANHPEWLQ